jgi:hypothetical protein
MSRLRPTMLTVALALGWMPAGQAAADEPESLARCEAHAGVAERVMRHRQETNDLESTWRMAGLIRNPQLSRVAQRLVPEAYRQTRRGTDDERERVASEFAEAARATCQASRT